MIVRKLWNKNFILVCVTYFFIACTFNLLMPTIPIYLSEKLAVPHSKIGIVLSSYAIALLIIRPFCGFWVDKYNRKMLLLLGTLLFVAAFVGYYFAVSVLFLVVLRFFHGMFWALSTVAANTVAIDIIPSKRRAEGIGYFGATASIAMAISPYIAVSLYKTNGFNYLVSCAIFMGVIGILLTIFIRVPFRVRNSASTPISFDRFILVKGIPILLNQVLLSFGWGTLVAYAILYGKETGVANPGVFFLFLALGIVLSRVVSGRLVDRGYLHNTIAIALITIAFGFICFAYLHGTFYYCLSAFFIGLGYGTLFPALQTLYINMAPAYKRGTANSTYLTGFDLGIGIGILIGSVIAGYTGYSTMYMLTAASCFLALIIYWLNSRKVYERNKLIKENSGKLKL
ncbi:MAG: MFS transporter [Bacteroidia bacterium]|nr:MFS transporter [Bacteroidia bacterium]